MNNEQLTANTNNACPPSAETMNPGQSKITNYAKQTQFQKRYN
jgi:hypothetical protein